MDHPPLLIPDYTLLRPIGRGSYGEVWLARSVTGLYRAIKIVYRAQFEEPRPYEREFAGIQRFEPISRAQESQVDILHVGRNEAAGYFYYVMELADDASQGESWPVLIDPQHYLPKTLKSVLAERQRLPVSETVPLAIALAEALIHLHSHGLVHRDIKPSNIIFVNGRPKLADIGLITRTDATRSFVGTEGFVPREGPGTAQADIFALGKVLYEACTGRDRLEFPSLPEDLETLPDRAELGELNEVLLKACDPDPALRYASGTDLKSDLELLRARKSIRRLRILERTVRRGRKFAISVSLLTLVISFGWYQSHRFNRMAASQLSRVYVKNGEQRLEQNDWLGALPWFSKALELETGMREREQAHQLRIANTLEWCPQLAAVYTHAAPARYAFFDAKADRVLICEPGTAAQIWDPTIDQAVTPKMEHGGQPFLGVFSPDGSRVATVSRGEGAARLWNARTGALIGRPILHGKQVNTVVFSADGQWLGTAGEDGWARVWRTSDGVEIGPALNHGAPVFALEFSRDGHRAMTVGGAPQGRSYVMVWEIGGGQTNGIALAGSSSLNAARFSPEGDALATGSASGELCLWRLGDSPARVWGQSMGYPILRIAFSQDGSRVVAAGEWAAGLWDGRSGQPIGPLIRSAGVLRAAEFSQDGSRFVLAGESRTAMIYDSRTGRAEIPLIKHGGEIYRAFFVTGAQTWITASADGTVRRWQEAQGERNRNRFSHPDPIKDVFITPDSRWVITSDTGGALRRWALGSEAAGPRQTRALPSPLTAGALSGDGQDVVLSTQDGGLLVVAVSDFATRATGTAPGAKIQKIVTNPHSTQAALAALDGSIWLWDWQSGSLERLPCEGLGPATQIVFSPDGRTLAAAAEKAALALRIGEAPRRAASRIQHNDRIWHIGFGREGKRLMVSSEDRVMRWWDPATGAALSPPIRGDGGINFAQFSEDHSRVFTASANYDAMIWNTSSGRPTTPPFKPHPGLSGATFSPDGHWLAISSSEGTLQIWDASTGEAMTPPLATAGAVSFCRFSPNGQWVVTVEDGRQVVCRPFLLEANPVAQARQEAALLSGYRVDDHGFLVPLDWQEMAQLAKAGGR